MPPENGTPKPLILQIAEKRRSSYRKKGPSSAVVTQRLSKSNTSRGEKPAPKQTKHGGFPIVAIGASAGGLEAFSQLLGALPADTGMAFVLVQHLDPKHESALPELLARRTTMPVEEAQQGLKLKPNHVYVNPPNASLGFSQGRLQLSPRIEVEGRYLPIDLFMRSLADAEKSRAIGVVLSGTASDGTQGLLAIKSEGGITFAQDGKSAKFDAMPRSAIAAGAVDFVLPAEEIARELGRISSHPYVNHRPARGNVETPAQSDGGLNSVFALLERAHGVDFSGYKPATVQRRIQRRIAIQKMSSEAEYVGYLKKQPAEVESLYNDLLIPVTRFFRDPKAFETLKKTAFPGIMNKRPGSAAVRKWVLGCSTGEEAYSLAIALLEFLVEKGANTPIQIFATDLSESGLQKARAGLYLKSIAHDVSPERLRRFFVEEENGYRISKAIRDMCVFARHNLLGEPPFSQMDLVSCRNVLIYLGADLQKRAIPILHYALKPNGFLLLGGSEGVTGFPNLFSAVDKKLRIYSKKAGPSHLAFDFVAGRTATAAAKAALPVRTEGAEPDLDAKREADRIVLAHYAPAGVIVDGNLEVVQFRGRTSACLEPAPGKASLNLLKMARGELALQLRTAVGQAKKKGAPVQRKGLRVQHNGADRNVNFEVIPLNSGGGQESVFLILFEEVPPAASKPGERRGAKPGKAGEREILRLRTQLAESQETLRGVIEEHDATREEFQAADEEVVSANEELQSTNEELETSKEELQSTNEELNTLNDELRNRNAELRVLNDDLINLQAAVNIPVVLLGRDLHIRRVTSAAEKQLKVIPSDVGRPINRIRLDIDMPELEPLLVNAMKTATVGEREVQDGEGHWYSLRVHPYRTTENKIDGAVMLLLDIDVLKRTGEEQRIAREAAQAIVETVRHPLLVLDSDLRVKQANASFYRTFQVSPQETDGRILYSLGNEQWNVPKLRGLLEEVLPTGKPVNDFAVEHDYPGIGHKVMLLNARKIHDPGSAKPLFLLALEDVTESEAKLAVERKHLAGIIGSAMDAIISVGEDQRIVMFNHAAEQMFHCPASEAQGQPLDRFIPERFRQAHRQHIEDFGHTGVTTRNMSRPGTLWGLRGDGEEFPIEATISQVEAGGQKLFTVILRDITERTEAETKLVEQAGLLELAPNAIIVRDEQGQVSYWNHGAEELYGWPREEAIGQVISELLKTESAKPLAEIIDQVRRDQRWEGELVHTCKNGTRVTVLSRWAQVRDATDAPSTMLEINTNITDRKKADKTLLTTEKLASAGRMAATLAHEINNPLETLTNLIYLAKNEPAIPETVQRYLTQADEELVRVAAMAKQTLGLYRGSAAAESVRVSDVFRSLLSIFSPRTKGKRIRVNLEVVSEVEVVAMRSELQQVFANLLANSIDAVALDGTIRIRIVAGHDSQGRPISGVRITVADNGVGIQLAVQSKMFEPFFTTKEHSGTGLGLWVSRQIIQKHHGSIRFRSSVKPGNTWTAASVFLPSDGMAQAGGKLDES